MIKRKKYWGNQLECSLAFKNNFNNSLTGLGLKGRKMRGDVAPGDLTHGDVAMKYKEYFKQYLRHFPKDNPNIDRSKAQSSVPKIYQVQCIICTIINDKAIYNNRKFMQLLLTWC